MDESRPPSPTGMTPAVTPRDISGALGYFSIPFQQFAKDDISDWASAFTLLDTVETYFDSRIDLFQRNFTKRSDKLRMRAEEAFKRIRAEEALRSPREKLPKDLDREVQKLKLKLSTRMTTLAVAWQSAKVVRTREKVTFFLGVMSLLTTALLFGMAPQWLHISYTVQAAYLLPMRAYKYKKRAWHYFLFDLCYYVTILNFVYIWIMPKSAALWIACYCLSQGSLASAVITWRNSLVFHDSDKVTSLFVHVYPPLVFTVIRHYYPNAAERFPALAEVPHLDPMRAFLLSGLVYIVWQASYWKFVLVDRRQKIESGQRTTSFSFLLNDKRGAIGHALSSVPPKFREAFFMFGQLVYAILTELPAVYVLYESALWSGVFVFMIFAVSVWNGGGFYIEVFGRKFERELEKLRKELAEATASRSGSNSPSGRTSPTDASADAVVAAATAMMARSDDEISSAANSPPTHPMDLPSPMASEGMPLSVDTKTGMPATPSEDKKEI